MNCYLTCSNYQYCTKCQQADEMGYGELKYYKKASNEVLLERVQEINDKMFE